MGSQAHRNSLVTSSAGPAFMCGPNDHFFPFYSFVNGGRSTRGVGGLSKPGDIYNAGSYGKQSGMSGLVGGPSHNLDIYAGFGPFGMNALHMGAYWASMMDGNIVLNGGFISWNGTQGTRVTGTTTAPRPSDWGENSPAGGEATYFQLTGLVANFPSSQVPNVCRQVVTYNRGIYQSIDLSMHAEYNGNIYLFQGAIRVLQGAFAVRVEQSPTITRVRVIREDGKVLHTASNIANGVNITAEDCQGMWAFFYINYTNTAVTAGHTFYSTQSSGVSICDLAQIAHINQTWPAPLPHGANTYLSYYSGSLSLPRGLVSGKSWSIAFWACFPQSPGFSNPEATGRASTYPPILRIGGDGNTDIDGVNLFWTPSANTLSFKSNRQGTGATQTTVGSVSAWDSFEWHHLAVTYDSATNTLKCYVDNILKATHSVGALMTFLPSVATVNYYSPMYDIRFNPSDCELLISGLVVRSGDLFSVDEIDQLYSGPILDPMNYFAIDSTSSSNGSI